jgi:trehalose-6-phosphatase
VHAEQHVGGKASRAEYEHHQGRWVYDVEVIKGKQVIDVAVNSTSGAIIAAVEDKHDREDDHDRTIDHANRFQAGAAALPRLFP